VTIDSNYSPESFTPNVLREYVFTFEYINQADIQVVEVLSDDTQILVDPNRFTLTGSGQLPIYDGGTVTFTDNHTNTTVSVVISRVTPASQLVDYQAYGSFPAETHEFALDKLTMIIQELSAQGVISGGEGPVTGDFIPLAGTIANRPVTGLIVYEKNTGFRWEQSQGNVFGVNAMTYAGKSPGSVFSIVTVSATAEEHIFRFTQDGQFEIPSFGAANNEVWVLQGADFFGIQNALSVYSFDTNTNLRTSNPILFYMSETETVTLGTDGKVITSGVIVGGDNDQVLTTKKYVDDAVGGIGGILPPSADGDVLIGTNPGWGISTNFKIDDNTTPGRSNVNMTGIIAMENFDDPGSADFMYMGTRDIIGGHGLVLYGTSALDSIVLSPEGYLGANSFSFTNGFLALPKEPTADAHAVTKLYVDDAIGGAVGLPSGLENEMLRHDGIQWVVAAGVAMDAAANLALSGIHAFGTLRVEGVSTFNSAGVFNAGITTVYADDSENDRFFVGVGTAGFLTNTGSRASDFATFDHLHPGVYTNATEDETITGAWTFNVGVSMPTLLVTGEPGPGGGVLTKLILPDTNGARNNGGPSNNWANVYSVNFVEGGTPLSQKYLSALGKAADTSLFDGAGPEFFVQTTGTQNIDGAKTFVLGVTAPALVLTGAPGPGGGLIASQILPDTNGTRENGGPSNYWGTTYTNEIMMGGNPLKLAGVPVAGGKITSDGVALGPQDVSNCFEVASCTIQGDNSFRVVLNNAIAVDDDMSVQVTVSTGFGPTNALVGNWVRINDTTADIYLHDSAGTAYSTAALFFTFHVYDNGR
jgi:hypothetical protein